LAVVLVLLIKKVLSMTSTSVLLVSAASESLRFPAKRWHSNMKKVATASDNKVDKGVNGQGAQEFMDMWKTFLEDAYYIINFGFISEDQCYRREHSVNCIIL
jgi:hypothetical protein